AEEALRQAALVLESSPVILFRWRADAEWSVELVSDNIAQFGYTPAELLSGETPYASIVHPDDIERVVQEVQAYSASGVERFDQEYRIITKDGQVRWTDDRTTIIRDAEGRITHYQGTVTDITERKQGEAERERLIAILTNSRDLIALTDMEGVVTYINPAGARLAGYEQPDQAVGKIIADFHAPEDLQRAWHESICEEYSREHTLTHVFEDHYEQTGLEFSMFVSQLAQNLVIGMTNGAEDAMARIYLCLMHRAPLPTGRRNPRLLKRW
ncbi:MAG: PAS domain S-box protein, partial [candidate division WOR-3 bacterium]